MSTESRTLMAKFDGDTAGLARAVDRAERKLGSYDKAADKAGRGTGLLGRAMVGVGTGGARAQAGLGFAGKGMGLLAGAAGLAGGAVVGAAAGLMKIGDDAIAGSLGVAKARIVFGESFPKMEKWARDSANAVGLTRQEALGLGASIQDFLVPMGVARGSAADMTTRFLNLSGVLAANSGGTRTAAEVTDIFTSALAGEYDSLQSLGIGISAARVQQVAADIQKRSSKKLTDAEAQALAILTIAEGDSTDAKQLSTTAEGKQAQAVAATKARVREQWQEIQQKLLPVVLKLWESIDQKVVPALQDFTRWLATPEGQAALKVWAQKVADITAAVASLISKLDTAAKWISKVAEASSGLGSVAGSVLGKIPGFAGGGTIPPHTTAMVGERGPEILTTGGRSVDVTPNHELGGPIMAEIHIEIGGEVVRVIRTEIKTDKRNTRRAVGAGATRGAAA